MGQSQVTNIHEGRQAHAISPHKDQCQAFHFLVFSSPLMWSQQSSCMLASLLKQCWLSVPGIPGTPPCEPRAAQKWFNEVNS